MDDVIRLVFKSEAPYSGTQGWCLFKQHTLLLWAVYVLDSVFKVNGFGGFGNYKAPSSLTSVSTRSPSECFLSLCVCVCVV